MVKSKQLKVGNETEQIIADYFQSLGFWVYILPKKIGGQPFDIIASKDKETWFVDAKHLEQNKASFSFERIEPNQKTAMKIATEKANMTNVGFFIYWDRSPGRLYYLPYRMYKGLEKAGNKSVNIGELICKPLSEVK